MHVQVSNVFGDGTQRQRTDAPFVTLCSTSAASMSGAHSLQAVALAPLMQCDANTSAWACEGGAE